MSFKSTSGAALVVSIAGTSGNPGWGGTAFDRCHVIEKVIHDGFPRHA